MAQKPVTRRSSPSPVPKAADEPILRTVYQRKSPEEQSLRRACFREVLRKTQEAVCGCATHRKPPTDNGPEVTECGLLDDVGVPGPEACPPPSQASTVPNRRQPAVQEEGPLRFGAAFESGNLLCAKLVTPIASADRVEYELQLDSDTQSWAGHTQWFYFCIYTQEFLGTVRLRSGVRADHSTLAFTYRIQCRHDEVYFASYPPYTYTMLDKFLAKLEEHELAREHFRRTELCKSLGELPVPLLEVSEKIRTSPEEGKKGRTSQHAVLAQTKRVVVVIARQHPGEVVGSWMVQGLLRFLLGPTPAAQQLREAYVFHVVPMVNVDGVLHGNSRCNLAGVDPNRVWHDPNPVLHPVIYALKNHLCSIAAGASIDMFLDFHGHSAKFGCFFYGSCPTSSISNALFPKLCAVASRDISLEQCHWQCPRSHRGTARYVVYKQFGVRESFTLECSFFAPVPRSRAATNGDGGLFTPGRVEWIGGAIGRASATFFGVAIKLDMGQLRCNTVPPTKTANQSDEPGCSAGSPNICDGQCAQLANTVADEGLGHTLDDPEGVLNIDDGSTQNPECSCSEKDFLPNLSCPKVLALRPWMTIQRLEETTTAEVLQGLIDTYGDVVPDFRRGNREGCDDGGLSDGDDGFDQDSDGASLRDASQKDGSRDKEVPQQSGSVVRQPPSRPSSVDRKQPSSFQDLRASSKENVERTESSRSNPVRNSSAAESHQEMSSTTTHGSVHSRVGSRCSRFRAAAIVTAASSAMVTPVVAPGVLRPHNRNRCPRTTVSSPDDDSRENTTPACHNVVIMDLMNPWTSGAIRRPPLSSNPDGRRSNGVENVALRSASSAKAPGGKFGPRAPSVDTAAQNAGHKLLYLQSVPCGGNSPNGGPRVSSRQSAPAVDGMRVGSASEASGLSGPSVREGTAPAEVPPRPLTARKRAAPRLMSPSPGGVAPADGRERLAGASSPTEPAASAQVAAEGQDLHSPGTRRAGGSTTVAAVAKNKVCARGAACKIDSAGKAVNGMNAPCRNSIGAQLGIISRQNTLF